MNRMKALIAFVFIIAVLFLLGNLGIEKRGSLNNDQPMIFAHRGVVNHSVENSFESFQSAKQLGFSAIETDISQTRDNHLILFHDKNAQRLLDIDKPIDELLLSEIKQKNLKDNGKHSDTRALTLDEFLDFITDSCIIYLDIKSNTKKTADSILSLFETKNLYQTALVADASISFLSYIKMKDPEIMTILEGFGAGKGWIHVVLPKKIKPDYYAGFIGNSNEQFMNFLSRKNLVSRYIAYGVDTSNVAKANKLGIQNIIIDHDQTLGLTHTVEAYTESIEKNN